MGVGRGERWKCCLTLTRNSRTGLTLPTGCSKTYRGLDTGTSHRKGAIQLKINWILVLFGFGLLIISSLESVIAPEVVVPEGLVVVSLILIVFGFTGKAIPI
jgi:hypothetical protein